MAKTEPTKPDVKPDDLQAEIARLQAENESLRGAKRAEAERDKVVAQKMALGLTRDQALAVIERQAKYEAALKTRLQEEKPAESK